MEIQRAPISAKHGDRRTSAELSREMDALLERHQPELDRVWDATVKSEVSMHWKDAVGGAVLLGGGIGALLGAGTKVGSSPVRNGVIGAVIGTLFVAAASIPDAFQDIAKTRTSAAAERARDPFATPVFPPYGSYVSEPLLEDQATYHELNRRMHHALAYERENLS